VVAAVVLDSMLRRGPDMRMRATLQRVAHFGAGRRGAPVGLAGDGRGPLKADREELDA
jgi:hypothetical protein